MLDTKSYIKVTKVIFAIVGLVHLLRLLMGFDLVIGGWVAPMWISLFGVIIPWYIAYNGYQLVSKKKK
ncbi:MAG TPA: hypothetical protein VG965_06810 [Patescibacteria group bacterium]|nr:hypothetical protein [Patescibacteria group bacterium]